MNILRSGLHLLAAELCATPESWRFAVLGVLYPSIFYVVMTVIAFTDRTPFVPMIGLVCLLGLMLNRWVFLPILLLFMFADAMIFVTSFFQMPVGMMVDALRFSRDLDIASSGIYVAIIGFWAVTVWLTFRTVQRARARRGQLSLLPFALVLLGFSGLYYALTMLPQQAAELENFARKPFMPVEDTATGQTAIANVLQAEKGGDILIVMVEGLGAFKDPALQDVIWGPLLSPQLAGRYEVTRGEAIYFGSTTAAEVRELCGMTGDYRDFRDQQAMDCLPARARAAGYQTTSYHGFTHDFFERHAWYPKLGFDQLNFLENNIGVSDEQQFTECGLTFRGLCDGQVAKTIHARLRQPDHTQKFIYWLTLNSHKPVVRGEVPDRLDCDNETNPGGPFKDVELCLMANQWLHISHMVHDMANDPALQPLNILLVGDHHPPLFFRSARAMFKPERVAWLHLKPHAQAQRQDR